MKQEILILSFIGVFAKVDTTYQSRQVGFSFQIVTFSIKLVNFIFKCEIQQLVNSQLQSVIVQRFFNCFIGSTKPDVKIHNIFFNICGIAKNITLDILLLKIHLSYTSQIWKKIANNFRNIAPSEFIINIYIACATS